MKIDLDTIGYFLFMEEQEQEKERDNNPLPLQAIEEDGENLDD